MCYIDLEPAEVWVETERKARKAHRCDACHGLIRRGDRYISHFDVFEGTATSEKLCLSCRDDRKEFADAHDGTLMVPNMMRGMIRECIGEEPEEAEPWKRMLGRMTMRRP